MFGSIIRNYRLSAAAVIVRNLLETHGKGSVIASNAGAIASRLVGSVYNGDPELFDGKRGKSPHKISVAALSLAQAFMDNGYDREAQLCYHLSLGTILVEVTGKPQNYAFNGNDHAILQVAQNKFLAFNSAKPVLVQRGETPDQRPELHSAAKGFARISFLKTKRTGVDLHKAEHDYAESALDRGATEHQALSMRWGGVQAIHADYGLYRHAVNAARDAGSKDWYHDGAVVYLTHVLVEAPSEFANFKEYLFRG